MLKKLLPLLLITVGAVNTFAAWQSEGPKREVETLMITSNYKSPRLLAEIIQAKNRQPYILIPAKESSDTRIYICTPKRAYEVDAQKLPYFIHWLNPERIVILGNETYVPKKYETLIDGSTLPIVRITGSDWARIAKQLSFMLAVSGVDKTFLKLHRQLTAPGGIYRPISKPAPAEVPAAAPAENAPAEAAVPEAAAEDAPAVESTAASVAEDVK